MKATHNADMDIYLNPGDFFFGSERARVRTVLGSCVSITMWHRPLRIGGMCHYMLPERSHRATPCLDGRYAGDAVALFLREIDAAGTRARDYEVKLFGGGRMLGSRRGDGMNIGQRNIEAGRRLLRQHGLNVQREHLAGHGHRNLLFDIASGEVWLKHVALPGGVADGADPEETGEVSGG